MHGSIWDTDVDFALKAVSLHSVTIGCFTWWEDIVWTLLRTNNIDSIARGVPAMKRKIYCSNLNCYIHEPKFSFLGIWLKSDWVSNFIDLTLWGITHAWRWNDWQDVFRVKPNFNPWWYFNTLLFGRCRGGRLCLKPSTSASYTDSCATHHFPARMKWKTLSAAFSVNRQ